MKAIYLILSFLICYGNAAFCQDRNKDINLIIVVDGVISVGNIMNIHLVPINKPGTNQPINVSYIPGRLSFTSLADTALINKTDEFFIQFDYYTNSSVGKKYYNFEIPLKATWIKSSYLILNVYNLDRKKYKNVYKPLSKTKNYNFTVTSPDYSYMLMSDYRHNKKAEQWLKFERE